MFLKGKDIEEYEGFALRLVKAANARGINSIKELAEAIDNHKECGKIVKIRKKVKEKASNPLANIIRNIQMHLNTEDVYDIPSRYLYAYSEVLECSLDYLYGRTEIISADLEVRDICERTGLTEEAVISLTECQKAGERFADDMTYAEWWSEFLQGESFEKLPQAWLTYADLVLDIKVIKDPPTSKYTAKDAVDEMKRIFPKLASLITDDDISEFENEEAALQSSKTNQNKEIQEKEDSKNGAYYKLLLYFEDLMSKYAEQWAEKRYPDYLDKEFEDDVKSMLKFREWISKIHSS